MAASGKSGGTLLGELVRAGDNQMVAEQIAEGIWLSKDVSNSYLVTGHGADLVVNAGMPNQGARHLAAYRAVSNNPIEYLVLTQGHFDHFGGLDAFREAGATVIAHRDLPQVRSYWKRLGPFYTRRSNLLWGNVLAMGQRPLDFQDGFDPRADIQVDDRHAFACGARRFELIATPGGETIDSLVVWMPDERIAFTGNLFGPIFLNHPNLNTLRGDLPRNALRFVDSVRTVQQLGAELLVTGHGDPVRGTARIQADLQTLIDAVLYVHDRTVAEMNAGKDVHTIMREMVLPESLRIGEGHGKVTVNVRSIWEQYAGFFHYRSPTELYGVPPAAVASDIVDLAGGTGPLTERARAYVTKNQPLEALHLLELVRNAAPDDRPARQVELSALEILLERGNAENFSETIWLKGLIAEAREALREEG